MRSPAPPVKCSARVVTRRRPACGKAPKVPLRPRTPHASASIRGSKSPIKKTTGRPALRSGRPSTVFAGSTPRGPLRDSPRFREAMFPPRPSPRDPLSLRPCHPLSSSTSLAMPAAPAAAQTLFQWADSFSRFLGCAVFKGIRHSLLHSFSKYLRRLTYPPRPSPPAAPPPAATHRL
jgi:hypothetical protein